MKKFILTIAPGWNTVTNPQRLAIADFGISAAVTLIAAASTSPALALVTAVNVIRAYRHLRNSKIHIQE